MPARIFKILSIIIPLVVAIPRAGAVSYSITNIGTLGGTSSSAYGINNNGQVIGSSDITGNTASHAFLYSDGTMQDLGSLGGNSSIAYGINNNGQVVGKSDINGGSISHAFFYSSGIMQDLGTLGGSASAAYGINDSGNIVGLSNMTGDSAYHAFLYSGGAMQDIGSADERSAAYGINTNDQVTGFDGRHAFLYSGNIKQDLGTFEGGPNFSSASAVNNSGQVVGWSSSIQNPSEGHAFLYSNGVMQDLGTFGGAASEAFGVNNRGQVVGSSFYKGEHADNGILHGFLYSEGTMLDLNNLISDSSWNIISARGINDLGQIVGYGEYNDMYTGFLMTPSDGPQPVPEPATVLLLLSGCICTWLFMRKLTA